MNDTLPTEQACNMCREYHRPTALSDGRCAHCWNKLNQARTLITDVTWPPQWARIISDQIGNRKQAVERMKQFLTNHLEDKSEAGALAMMKKFVVECSRRQVGLNNLVGFESAMLRMIYGVAGVGAIDTFIAIAHDGLVALQKPNKKIKMGATLGVKATVIKAKDNPDVRVPGSDGPTTHGTSTKLTDGAGNAPELKDNGSKEQLPHLRMENPTTHKLNEDSSK